ncbi:MAG: DUF1995 family protein [Cyanobacteria bacterium P01_A01_bin.114]
MPKNQTYRIPAVTNMSCVPTTLEAATDQAKVATKSAIQAGLTRLQVEMVIPELKHQPIAEQFLELFSDLGLRFKVYFPDAGAAALARRDWGEPDFSIRGINEIQGQPNPDDDAFLVVNPSSVEVSDVEKLCGVALDRPVILLNPQLEDVATVGIGYAARQLRERFLSQLESCYYLRPLDGAVILRSYPQSWQIWKAVDLDDETSYTLLTELPQRPSSEAIDRLLYGDKPNTDSSQPKRSVFAELQQFLRALMQ